MSTTLTIATCNILAQDPYERHSSVPILTAKQRQHNFITSLTPLLSQFDIICFQEWDYTDSGIIDQIVFDFFEQHGFDLIGRESNIFGTMIGYKKNVFSHNKAEYNAKLFDESLIYGYHSILLVHEKISSLRVTTTHLPYRRKKKRTAEDYLNLIPAGREKNSIICGDFNETAIDFNETHFKEFSFSRDFQMPKVTHRLNAEKPGSLDFYQSVDYIGIKGGSILSLSQFPEDKQLLLSHSEDTRESTYFSDHALMWAHIKMETSP